MEPEITPEVIRCLGLAAGVAIPEPLLEPLAANYRTVLDALARLRQYEVDDPAPAAVFQMEPWR